MRQGKDLKWTFSNSGKMDISKEQVMKLNQNKLKEEYFKVEIKSKKIRMNK